MDSILLLDDEQIIKWHVLQLLEMKRNDYIYAWKLMELLSISKYKVEKILEEINQDCANVDTSVRVILYEDGEIRSENLNVSILKKMKMIYLETSMLYRVFSLIISGEASSVEGISKKLFVSQSVVYAKIKKMNEILNSHKLALKKLRIVGDELLIRGFIFSVLNDFYNGMKFPFDVELKIQTNKMVNHLYLAEPISMKRTQEFKLKLYISISLMRMRNGYHLDRVYVKTPTDVEESILRTLVQMKKMNRTQALYEISGLMLYLANEQLVALSDDEFLEGSKHLEAKRLTDTFLSSFDEDSPDSSCLTGELYEALTALNRKWLTSHLIPSTFIFEEKRSYLKESFPRLTRLILDFFQEETVSPLFYSDKEKTKMFYDYVFLILAQVPAEVLEEPIYVCVDFFHGESYNQFIQNSIASFQDIHIVFEPKVSKQTQLYLSDYYVDNLSCDQIIWKSPPTSNDWQDFGNRIVAIKGASS